MVHRLEGTPRGWREWHGQGDGGYTAGLAEPSGVSEQETYQELLTTRRSRHPRARTLFCTFHRTTVTRYNRTSKPLCCNFTIGRLSSSASSTDLHGLAASRRASHEKGKCSSTCSWSTEDLRQARAPIKPMGCVQRFQGSVPSNVCRNTRRILSTCGPLTDHHQVRGGGGGRRLQKGCVEADPDAAHTHTAHTARPSMGP